MQVSRLAWQRGTIIMAMNDSPSEEPRPAVIEKKPYQKPAFRHEQVFVTSALSCTKLFTEANCQHGSIKVS